MPQIETETKPSDDNVLVAVDDTLLEAAFQFSTRYYSGPSPIRSFVQ
jgi:hypothetical protein